MEKRETRNEEARREERGKEEIFLSSLLLLPMEDLRVSVVI